jgi:hypothetical protein
MPLKPDSPRRLSTGRTRREIDDFDADAANKEMAQKLQRNTLRRKARAQGLELRHSAYGYSLIDAGRTRVEGRNDFTLDDVQMRLDAAHESGTASTAKRSGRRV